MPMQIKIISVPILGGEAENAALNQLLQQKKVIELKQELITTTDPPVWSFLVKYVDDYSPYPKKERIDYKEVLDPVTFGRYSKLREIRKQVAEENGVRTYLVFTNAELAELAKHEQLTQQVMLGVKGIGEQKFRKYGHYFLDLNSDEKSESSSSAN